MSQTSCCVPNCTVQRGMGVTLHSFPNPNNSNHIERFRTWVMKIGGEIVGKDDLFIYKNRKVCHRHFEAIFIYSNRLLNSLAVPTRHIPGVNVGPMRVPLSITREPLSTLVNEPLVQSMSEPAASATSTPSECPKPGTSSEHHAIVEQVPVRKNKSMSKTERELHNILSHTKAKLRKCLKKKETLKTKLMLARKIRDTIAFKRLSNKMSPAAQTFFEIQIGQFGKKAKGRRFTLEEKVLALSIYKPSPKAYRLFSKICILPKKRTLDKLLCKVQLLPGINELLFEYLKKCVDKMPTHHRFCTLVFDEMAISAGLSYDKTNDVILGLNDNGSERNSTFSDHVLVFMVRGIYKKFKQPISFTFCSGSTKTYCLKNQITNVLQKLTGTGLNIVATVCDQGSTNIAAINNLMEETKAAYFRKNKNYIGGFFEIDERKIYPIFDPPHLIKGIRNNLLTKDLVFESEGKIKKAQWSHLEALFQKGPSYKSFSLVPKLTAEHIIANKIRKMKVKYCTQVFSQSVGVAMGYMTELGQLPKESQDTADLLLFFDKLFDSVNGNFSKPEKGKILRSAVTPTSGHQDFWHQSLRILRSMVFLDKQKKSIVPSLTSWIKTIQAFQSITKYLHSQGLNSLLLRNFNQDPLEN